MHLAQASCTKLTLTGAMEKRRLVTGQEFLWTNGKMNDSGRLQLR